MSATDFNLSAAISVQLATGSGAKLASDITKILNNTIKDMKPTITPVLGTMSAQLQRIFPKNKNTGVTVKVNVEVGKAKGTTELKELLANKTLKIDVEFSDKAKKAIDDFSTSLSKLRESSKGFEELQKLVKYMNTVGKVDLNNLSPVKDTTAKKAKKAEKLFNDFSKKIDEIGAKARDADKGGFFDVTSRELKALVTEIGKASTVIDRFGGINGKPIKNLEFALKSVYSAYAGIETKQRKLEKSGLLGVTPGLNDSLEKAKRDVVAILTTLNAAEDLPLAASIKAATKPMDDLITSAGQYRKLLREIRSEQRDAAASGASADRIDLINQRKLLIESSRDKGINPETLKGQDDYIDLVARAKNFTQVERSAFKAANSVERYRNEVNLNSDFKTQGAVESGSVKKVEKLLAAFEALYLAEAKIGKSDSVQIITQELDKLKLAVSAVKDEATAFDAVLKSFDDKKAFFDSRGLKESAKLTEENKKKLIDAQKATGGISTSSNIFQQINQTTESFAENEKKIYKFILAIDKLKASLQFSIGGGQDFTGIGTDIQKLESRISSMINNFDERKVKETLTSDSYKIRAKDKLNKVINSSFDSFDQAIVETASAGAGISKLGPAAFTQGRAELDKMVQSLNLTSDSYADIGKNIDLVKSKADKLYALATIKAEGGFIGAITKSLGLAAKRLTTFLFAARAIYGVQNAIIDATTSAVELDTEFTRLEQIFAGSQDRIGSVEKNVASLSSEILTLAKNYGVAATEIAKSADIFAQAGIQGRSLEKILEISTKARLGPTFGSNIEISEAIIASMNQFKIKADEMEDVIGGISQVSAQFAVESDGITKAIRRAGGSFAAAKADGQSYMSALADFVGAFTVLKEQTREADETLATSLRNVLNRLQRSNVRKYLQDNFNINLLDANNQFIGFSEAISRVANRIKELGIKSGDPRFAELVQKLAGSLQSSRLTSLLAGAGDISRAVAEFQKGGESLNRDTDIAFGSLENKLSRAKNAVVELFTEIARSNTVKSLVELFTILTQTITGALKAISGFNTVLLGTGAILAGIKSFGAISQVVVRGVAGLSQSGLLGPGKGFNTGGLVPGIGPNVDTEPYMLTKGEYVINRNAVNKYGKSFFNDLNSGKINYAATGSGPNGLLSNPSVQEIINKISIQEKAVASKTLSGKDLDEANREIGRLKYELNNLIKILSGLAHTIQFVDKSYDTSGINTGAGGSSDGYASFRRKKKTSMVDIIRQQGAFSGGPAGATSSIKRKNTYKNDYIEETTDDIVRRMGGRSTSAVSESAAKKSFLSPSGGGNNPPPNGPKPPGGGGSGPRNPDPPNGPKPPGGGGNNPPPNGPNTPVSKGSFFDVNKLSIFGGALTAATIALGFYANSSKDASDKVKILMDAVIAATTAVTAYTIATNGATTASAFLSKFGTKASVNGVTENVTDLAKGFGGGGFFDKYGKGGTPVSGVGGPVGRFGRVVNGVRGATGFLNNGIGKVAGQAGAKLATYVPSFAKLGSAALTAAKFLGPQVLGAAVVGLVSAMGSFNNAAIRASEEIIANSTSEREVIEERANINKRQKVSNGLNVLGKVAGGAALGATVAGPVGAAIGAVGGFFLGIFTQFKDSKIGTIVSNGLKFAGEYISAFFDVVGNGIGWMTGKIDDVFNSVANLFGVGVSEADINKKKDFQANIDKGGANLNSFNRGFKRKGGATDEEFNNLFKAVQQTSNVTSGYKSLSDEDKTKAKGQAERLKSALDGVNAFQRGTIIEKAKKSGIDIANMFDQVGLEFDQVGPAAAIASDKLSKMFANMQSVSDRVNGIISNFNTGNDIISNRAAGIAGEGTAGGVSAGVFQNLRSGAAPSGLATEETNKLFRDLEAFSPAAALNARVEAGGARAAFDVKNQLVNKDIKIGAGNTGDQVGNLIGDMFDKSLQGQPKEVRQRLNDMLDTYLDSQQEALNGVVGADNSINNEKVGEVINGFTESIKRGGLDTAEAFNGANQQFKQAMDGIIKRRIEYENKITALGRQNVDRQKSFIEFQNKAAGKPDTAINLAQAKGLDAQRQGILLRGSGLGGNASVADIRNRYDQLTAQDPGGNDPAIQALKDNLYTALEGMASGTDSFTTAIREFDKASEQAKRRTEELSNALLGTDENLFNTLKGINLEQRVLGAGDKGQAFLALQGADDASRQALQQRLSSDPERKAQFEAALGLGSNISASREAQNVANEFGNQQLASDAMIGINQKLADNMTGLVGELTKNREAFNTFGLQINNFANAANNLANNLGNIPQNIAHAHTFKVDPIQISFTGAEALAALDGPMKGVITEIVNTKIGEFANNLKSKNKGLTVDSLTGNTVTA